VITPAHNHTVDVWFGHRSDIEGVIPWHLNNGVGRSGIIRHLHVKRVSDLIGMIGTMVAMVTMVGVVILTHIPTSDMKMVALWWSKDDTHLSSSRAHWHCGVVKLPLVLTRSTCVIIEYGVWSGDVITPPVFSSVGAISRMFTHRTCDSASSRRKVYCPRRLDVEEAF
jgi:hypothetical protein